MTSSPHGLYVQGYTRTTMAGTKGREPARGGHCRKAAVMSDRSLQLDSLKSESLVFEYQQDTVDTFPSLVHTTDNPGGVASTRRA